MFIPPQPRRFMSSVAGLIALVMTSVSQNASSAALALFDALPAMDVHHLEGPDKGSSVCPMCRYGYDAGMLLWVPPGADVAELQAHVDVLSSVQRSVNHARFRVFVIHAQTPGPALRAASRAATNPWYVVELQAQARIALGKELGDAVVEQGGAMAFVQRRLLRQWSWAELPGNGALSQRDAVGAVAKQSLVWLEHWYRDSVESAHPDIPRGELWLAPQRLGHRLELSPVLGAAVSRRCLPESRLGGWSQALLVAWSHADRRRRFATADSEGCVDVVYRGESAWTLQAFALGRSLGHWSIPASAHGQPAATDELPHRLRYTSTLEGTSRNLLRVPITSLLRARNPHGRACPLRFLCAVRLVLDPLATVSRGSLNLWSLVSQRPFAGLLSEGTGCALFAQPGCGNRVQAGQALRTDGVEHAVDGREPLLTPCEGCEAAFDGLPARLSSRVRLAPRAETGTALQLSGVVRDRQGRPVSGVVLYAHQTNAHGSYPPDPNLSGAAALHGTLRAWVITDAVGGYRFETIRPGAYPGGEIAAHIHLQLVEPGRCHYFLGDVLFDDDPGLSEAERTRQRSAPGGSGIVRVRKTDDGQTAQRDIVLGLNVPDYDERCKPLGG